jgi:hypothetical protein
MLPNWIPYCYHIGYIKAQPGALECIEEKGLHEAFESHSSRTGLLGSRSRISLYAHGESPCLSDKACLPKKPTLPKHETLLVPIPALLQVVILISATQTG